MLCMHVSSKGVAMFKASHEDDQVIDLALSGLFSELQRCEGDSIDLGLLARHMQAVDTCSLTVGNFDSYEALWRKETGTELVPEKVAFSEMAEPGTSPQSLPAYSMRQIMKIFAVVVPIVCAALFMLVVVNSPYLYMMDDSVSLKPLLYGMAFVCLIFSVWYVVRHLNELNKPSDGFREAASSSSARLST